MAKITVSYTVMKFLTVDVPNHLVRDYCTGEESGNDAGRTLEQLAYGAAADTQQGHLTGGDEWEYQGFEVDEFDSSGILPSDDANMRSLIEAGR